MSSENVTRTSSCTLAQNRDVVRIATKSSDAHLNPLQSGTLIMKGSVGLKSRCAQFFRSHESKMAESVALECQYNCTKQTNARYLLYDDANNRQLVLRRELYQTCWI
jgi:hypothetical protein